VALVHNGIFENYAELRAELQSAGVKFRSETDTEVLAHLDRPRADARVARCSRRCWPA
jgi:glucosamine 6-phosphate synthetase-like amidotransferase/phosphosugar isomerase protein